MPEPALAGAVARAGGEALAGVGVLVTRPRGRAGGLSAALEVLGARVVEYPAIAIEPVRRAVPVADEVAHWPARSIALFVSVNAVAHFLDGHPEPARLLAGVELGAIGAATARALVDRGLVVSIGSTGGGVDSEALLAAPALAPDVVRGRHVVIVKGKRGRDTLERELRERGAGVATVDVYRRVRPAADPGPVARMGARGAIDAIVVTSAEGAANLLEMLGPARPWLSRCTWVVPSERVAARLDGLLPDAIVVVAAGAGDAAIVTALVEARTRRPVAG